MIDLKVHPQGLQDGALGTKESRNIIAVTIRRLQRKAEIVGYRLAVGYRVLHKKT